MQQKMYGYDGPDFRDVEERIQQYVRPDGDHLIWIGPYAENSPVFHHDGNRYRAAYVMWQLADGWLPEGLGIRPTCDNPKCVAPAHYRVESDLLRFFNQTQWGDERCGVDGTCLEWTGYLDSDGYGRFSTPEGPVLAHRWIYQRLRGPISTGREIHHCCHNRGCVNIDHLTAVTHAENMRYMAERRKQERVVALLE